MSKLRIASLSVGMALGLAALSASAATAGQDIGFGLKLSGDVHAATDYSLRGVDLNDDGISGGTNLKLVHGSGLLVKTSVDTAKFKGNGVQFGQVTVGYGTDVGSGVSIETGVTRFMQFGQKGLGLGDKFDFTELYAGAAWNGAHAKLGYVVDGSAFAPQFAKGGTYLELGYTHPVNDKLAVGADVGYNFVSSDGKKLAAGADDHVAFVKLHAGYDVTSALKLGVAYQTNAGADGLGAKATGDKTTTFNVSYKF